MKNAVVLLSGGLDSSTVLAIARAEGFVPHALSFRYGQRHLVELESAKRVAAALGAAEHVIAEIDLRRFGGSALTADIAVPKGRDPDAIGEGIPVTYVPARNTVFLSFALAWAEVLKSSDIFIGVNALDYSGYPDCRPEYIAAFERMANLATAAGVDPERWVAKTLDTIVLAPLVDPRLRPKDPRGHSQLGLKALAAHLLDDAVTEQADADRQAGVIHQLGRAHRRAPGR